MQESAQQKKNNGEALSKDEQAASSKTGPSGSAGIGSASGSQSSTTYSGISGGTITITNNAAQSLTGKTAAEVIASLNRDVTTGKDSSNSLVKAWDGQQLQQEVQAQAQITGQFGAAAAKGIGDYADKMHDEAKAMLKNAESETDPEKKAAMVQAATELDDNWTEGGAYRVLAHTIAGGLGGGLGGAVGAGSSALAAQTISKIVDGMDLPDAVKQAVGAAAAAVVGSVGGVAGVAGAVNVDVNNRQLHEDGKAKEKTLAKQLSESSDGKYTLDQIEDALRAANNKQLGEMATTGASIPYDTKTAFYVYDSNGMVLGRAADGTYVLMQNPAMLATPSSDIQTFIKNNTGDVYSWNSFAPQLPGIPLSALPPIMNGTVTPEMVASRKNDAAEFASWMSTQSGRIGSAATLYGTYLSSQPNAVSQTGASIQFAIAGVAEVVSFGAGALEQLLRPNVGQTLVSGGVDIFTHAITTEFPLLSPVFTEAGTVVKDTRWAANWENTINNIGKK